MKMKKRSSQWTQFMQLGEEAWKKFRTSTGFEPVTSRLPLRCSTNWDMKPLTLGAGQLWVHIFPWKKWVLMIYENKWYMNCGNEVNHGNIWNHNWPAPNVSGFMFHTNILLTCDQAFFSSSRTQKSVDAPKGRRTTWSLANIVKKHTSTDHWNNSINILASFHLQQSSWTPHHFLLFFSI